MPESSAPNDLYWIDAAGTAHERCRLLVYVGADFLGESPIDPGDCPELGYRRGGTAYFCSQCGEIWGRLVLVGLDGKIKWFDALDKVSCQRHSDQWNVPGSLLGGSRNEGYLNYLPPAALQREFLIHLKHAEMEL